MRFDFLASTKDGKIRDGNYEASNKEQVIEYILKQDLTPISIKEGKKSIMQKSGGISLFSKVSASDKILLTRNLSSMIAAGMDILEAIEILYDDAEKPILKKIFSIAKFNLEKGQTLSSVFEKFPKQFSSVFINAIKSGEESGTLEQSLKYLSIQLKKENDLIKKVKSALAYPALLLMASLSIVTVLIVFVLPRITKVFAQSGIELPLPTRILMNISDFVLGNWLWILITLGIVVVFIRLFKMTQKGQVIMYNITSRIPLVGSLSQKVILSRLARSLASLLKSGTPIIKALKVAADATGNSYYRRELYVMAEKEISKGVSVGGSLKHREEMFPKMFISLISIGEKTGTMETVLDSLADFYEEEVDSSLKTLVSALEPTLLIVMGIIVGAIAISIILPIYSLVGGIT